MSPHSTIDMLRSGSELEPPQLVSGDRTGWTTPNSDGTTSDESSRTASEPIAIVGMGKIRIQVNWLNLVLT